MFSLFLLTSVGSTAQLTTKRRPPGRKDLIKVFEGQRSGHLEPGEFLLPKFVRVCDVPAPTPASMSVSSPQLVSTSF